MTEPYIKSLISVNIEKSEEKKVKGKEVTFYIIEFTNNYSKKRWKLEKRYKEFDELHSSISKLVPKCPSIPSKGFFGLSLNNEELIERQNHLDSFLKQCCERKDIMTTEVFKKFIEIESNAPETAKYKHQLITEFTKLPLGVRDFVYNKEHDLIFIACSDMNIISRIDSYVTNVNLPWEKKTDGHLSVGATLAIRLSDDKGLNSTKFEKIWAKSYPTQTGVIVWDENSSTLAVGLDDGRIIFYKTVEKNVFSTLEQITELKPHKDRVMGIAIDSSYGYVYSVGTDKKFVVSEANSSNNYTQVSTSEHGFTNLSYDKSNNRVFTSNEGGSISVFNVAKVSKNYI